ncbi:GntR family transcriptional regulator [Paracoccus sp. MKU1]|uniref:GntR family transcriptional regulator n=2 Tax=Paracoccus sp. MKU1 TaxID=1745182 RepID=UPI0007193BD1|nr:GntR family transcriptional regulator [Paracoccus sp. MKU1]KRW96725.1 GntR family transcriptional regulator [Paracoccus sp. MKU1]
MCTTTSFRVIKADILRRISGGEWPPGSLLPNELALAREFGAARATVGRAMRELVDDGIVERKRKTGTRVRPVPLRQVRLDIPLVRVEVEAQGSSYRYALVSSESVPAPNWLRARLDLRQGAEMLHLVCLHLSDGHPYQLEDRWINLGAVPQARQADFSTLGPSEWLTRQMPFSDIEISFSASAAEPEQARQLSCAVGDPLFRIERQTFWEGRPITFVRMVYRCGHRLIARY